MRITAIPLTPQAQRFKIPLGETTYSFRLLFDIAQGGFWTLDIGDEAGRVPLLCGVPLVTGVDLLAQHRHLGFAGKLVVTATRDVGEVPNYSSLGTTTRLYFIAD